MAHPAQQGYFRSVKARYPERFRDATVIDCGSLNINGSLREHFEGGLYLGVDQRPGHDVNLVHKIHLLPFVAVFDVVVSAEMLEHSEHWRDDLEAMYRMCKPGGLIVMSCAGTGREEHGTARTGQPSWGSSPDHYRNLTPADIIGERGVFDLDKFSWSECIENAAACDTYFAGIKK